MTELSYSCSLRSFFPASPKDAEVSEALPAALYTKAQLIEIIQDSLKNLRDLCSSRKDLKQAVTQMYNASVNWERAPPDCNEGTTQLRGLYPIRSPLPWLPSMIMDILNRDPLDILFAAHYNMLAIGCSLVSPAVKIPFGLVSRAHIILAMADRSFEAPDRNLSSSHDRRASDTMRRHMVGPIALAHHILASEEATLNQSWSMQVGHVNRA
jgi:hypothetical protein